MTESAHPDQPIVFIVDDDTSVRNALVNLFQAVGLEVEGFASAEAFLSSKPPERTSCLVLDVRLPGVSGLNIQEELAKAGIRVPIIFLTGHADVPMTVRAMKAGAVDFLTKPFRDQDLLDAVQSALKLDGSRRQQTSMHAELRATYGKLTPREREVLALIATGLINKQIADRMGIAEITVKIHRSRLSHKMGAQSLAELLNMAHALGIGGNPPGMHTHV